MTELRGELLEVLQTLSRPETESSIVKALEEKGLQAEAGQFLQLIRLTRNGLRSTSGEDSVAKLSGPAVQEYDPQLGSYIQEDGLNRSGKGSRVGASRTDVE